MQPKPKFILGTTAVVVLLILLSLSQEANRRWQVQQEVAYLEQDVQQLQKNVIELKHLNQYFRTDDYQERLAREKLNYRAEGEHVVLIPEEDIKEDVKPSLPHDTPEEPTNPVLWWKVFFVDEISSEERAS